MEISLPFLPKPIGLGDAVKSLTATVGLKPCAPCQKRAERLNRAVTLTPRSSGWPQYPGLPEGWSVLESRQLPKKIIAICGSANEYIVWEVIDGKYRNSYRHNSLGGARDKMETLCQK